MTIFELINNLDEIELLAKRAATVTLPSEILLQLVQWIRREQERRTPPAVPIHLFWPGLHEHYRGGQYRALFIATHHETGEAFVVYVPYEHPESGVRLREWCTAGADSWRDEVEKLNFDPEDEELRNPKKIQVPRFRWVTP